MLPFFQVVAGLILLIIGGEALVRGAVAFSKRLGVPTLIVGLTIVSFGTSAPELFISANAVLKGHPDISIGNIIGSNIANILLVLGATAMIYPITVESKLLKRDAPLMLFATVLFIIFCNTGSILARYEAAILLSLLIAYTIHIFRSAKSGKDTKILEELEEETSIQMSMPLSILSIIAGCGMLIHGADILVEGATILAHHLGVSEGVIGLTVLAIGSSAPELVTAVVAARRKHSDIALGNIVGSNLFNIAMIGGTAAMIKPISVASQFTDFDVWVMLIITLILMIFMFTGRTVCRKEGIVLFTGYIAYSIWLYVGLK